MVINNKIRTWNETIHRMFYKVQVKTIYESLYINQCMYVCCSKNRQIGLVLENAETKIMLSSGFKDKNSRAIYESDIIKYKDLFGVVTFDHSTMNFNIMISNKYFDILDPYTSKCSEIVGNIFQGVESALMSQVG